MKNYSIITDRGTVFKISACFVALITPHPVTVVPRGTQHQVKWFLLSLGAMHGTIVPVA